MSTTTYRNRNRSAASKAEAAEKRSAEIKDLKERLAAYQETTAPELIAAALASHDGYSDRNAMLIALQCPTATDVTGFTDWNERGRAVRPGEHGIRIIRPNGTYTAGKGTDQEEERPRFSACSVFDISQTWTIEEAAAAFTAEGKQLPPAWPPARYRPLA